MPTCAVADNPPVIWPENSEIADLAILSPIWVVIQTLYNREKAMAFELIERRIPYFLPLLKDRDKYRRRTLKPLFERFLFAAIPVGMDVRFERAVPSKGLWRTYQSGYKPFKNLFRTYMVHDEQRFVKELAVIKTGIDSGELSDGNQIVPGLIVEIIDGALQGIGGEVERVDRDRGVACISANGKQLEVPIASLSR